MQKLYFVGVTDVSQVTGPINELLRRRVLDECLVLNSVSLATILAHEWDAEFADLAAALLPWTAILCVAGYARQPGRTDCDTGAIFARDL